MKTVTKNGVTTVVAQNEVVIPDLTIKDLLSVIPSVRLSSSLGFGPADTLPLSRTHCFQRSALRSSLYV
jgi:omega-6 fatty acid desaturase (delta-12 desaturase)